MSRRAEAAAWLTLTRQPLSYADSHGVFGALVGDGFESVTVEPPWRGNAPDISCVPPGTYELVHHSGPKYQDVPRLDQVPGRGAILIHAGNWAGEGPELRCDSEGCVLVGRKMAIMSGQIGVTSSRDTLADLMSWIRPRWRRGPVMLRVVPQPMRPRQVEAPRLRQVEAPR